MRQFASGFNAILIMTLLQRICSNNICFSCVGIYLTSLYHTYFEQKMIKIPDRKSKLETRFCHFFYILQYCLLYDNDIKIKQLHIECLQVSVAMAFMNKQQVQAKVVYKWFVDNIILLILNNQKHPKNTKKFLNFFHIDPCLAM